MSTKSKSATPIADKARKAALAAIEARIAGTPNGARAAATPPRKAKGGKGAKAKTPKAAKPAKAPKEKKAKKVSCLDAAAQVIAASKVPMRATEMIAEMEKKGLWKTPGGKTPEATLYAAVIREISAKGDKARFKKHDRGVFVAGKGA
ncbi:hypothetical protein PHYC_02021 [Phycisphaerales bacterium]|nr:hypothetical protein PHYC_02021 [Phycisphaerales bacterium]